MKIRILPETGGVRMAFAPGEVYDLPKALAQELLDSGDAEPVEPEKGKRTASQK